MKKQDAEVLGWRRYKWAAVVMPVGRTAKFSKTTLEAAYGREMNIKFPGNNFGGHFCQLHAPSKLETSVAFCLCDKTAHLSGILLYTAQGAPV